MVDWYQAIVLGIVQGLTEFLPISSTAHLRIVPHYLGWGDPGTAFSAVIQLGTLGAVFVYFASDIQRLSKAACLSLVHKKLFETSDSREAWAIAAGTIPIVVLGLSLKDFIETEARSLTIIGTALIVLGILLYAVDHFSKKQKTVQELGFVQIQLIGLCQALALIPGCSRSGSTIMGGLLLGLNREAAARFSFLLGLPAIAGSGLLELVDLLEQMEGTAGLFNLALGLIAAFISGYLSIGFLIEFLKRYGTFSFMIYRVLLGTIILLQNA